MFYFCLLKFFLSHSMWMSIIFFLYFDGDCGIENEKTKKHIAASHSMEIKFNLAHKMTMVFFFFAKKGLYQIYNVYVGTYLVHNTYTIFKSMVLMCYYYNDEPCRARSYSVHYYCWMLSMFVTFPSMHKTF